MKINKNTLNRSLRYFGLGTIIAFAVALIEQSGYQAGVEDGGGFVEKVVRDNCKYYEKNGKIREVSKEQLREEFNEYRSLIRK